MKTDQLDLRRMNTPKKWSRRYTCNHCGFKGRVSNTARGRFVRCAACKKQTKATEQKNER